MSVMICLGISRCSTGITTQTAADEIGFVCIWPCPGAPQNRKESEKSRAETINKSTKSIITMVKLKTVSTGVGRTCVNMNRARTIWIPLSKGCMRKASLNSWSSISTNWRMVSNQNPANSGTFKQKIKSRSVFFLYLRYHISDTF